MRKRLSVPATSPPILKKVTHDSARPSTLRRYHRGRAATTSVLACLLSAISTAMLLTHCSGRSGAPAENGIKQVNGAGLYYTTFGTGEPLLILHGGPGLDHTYLLPQMSKLAERYRLVFYDQRGSGNSVTTVDSTSITLVNFVEDAERIRRSLNLGAIHLMGHSWGAMLAMAYALEYPQNVRSLILANPGGASSEFLRQGLERQKARLTQGDKVYLATLTRMEAFKNRDPESVQEYFRVLFRATFHDRKRADSLTLKFSQATATNVTAIGQILFRGMGDFDFHRKFGALRTRTLIIHGTADAVPLEAAEKLCASMPTSQLVVLQNTGHFPFVESPDEFFNAVTGFLAQAPH